MKIQLRQSIFAKLVKRDVHPRSNFQRWVHGLIEPKTWTDFKAGKDLCDIFWNLKVKLILDINKTSKKNSFCDKDFHAVWENVYIALTKYNMITYVHYRVD